VKNLWSHPISRDWEAIAGGKEEVVCFSNGEPRLSSSGAQIALTFDEENGYWVAGDVPLDAPLVLETLRDGKAVARDAFGPRGDAVRIDTAIWQAPTDAQGKFESAGLASDGVIQVECSLLDAQGEVARNELIVSAEMEGGTLLFLENGDLSDNTPYAARYRSTFEGRIIVFVRADGPATLRLSAPGLPDAMLSLNQVV